ncbi:MAG: undecaprenyl-diphosphate phosphatase [Planctomycetota bacterium]
MAAGEEGLSYLAALLLGLLQGVAEFLPVSSSGHLALAEHLGYGGGIPLAFDLLLHLATVLVVLRTFWEDIRRILRSERRVLLYLAAGSVPAGALGVLFRDTFADIREKPLAVSAALLVTAGFLFFCDRIAGGARRQGELGVKSSLVIGLAQALAITPGISRSGLTITGGVVCGLTRREAIRFSFLLMVPAVCGASLLDAVRYGSDWTGLPPGPAFVGFLAAFVSGTASLRFLTSFVLHRRLSIFAVYCVVVGLAGILYFSLR